VPKITPFLWFNDNAEDAANFYLSVFPNSRKLGELRSDVQTSVPPGALLIIDIELEGQQITFLNGGTAHQLSEAVSLYVNCDTQAEIDHYWAVFGDGGTELGCGWIKDKFGLCWQIVPTGLKDLLRKAAVMRAMMSMQKFDIAALKAAAQS